MESYEKKYNELVGKIEKAYLYAQTDSTKAVLEDILPKLKESEDEKIRKSLIDFFSASAELGEQTNGVYDKDIITWLEKQKSVEEIVARCKNSWFNVGKIQGMKEGLTEEEKYQQGWHDAHEKQGEQNPYSGVTFKYNGHTWGMCARDNGVEILVDGEIKERVFLDNKPKGKSALEAIKEEKVDNANKVEPKFHEDDWLVNRNGGLWKIKRIFKNTYEIESLFGDSLQPIKTVDTDCRLWTIADAKEGDILSNGRMVVIFKEFEEPSYREHFVAYIGLDDIGNIQVTDGTWQLGDKAHPATKYQRDTLLKAMANAGWTFDFEKKELKKIEDEEYNGEDYGIDSLYHAQAILEKTLGKVEGYQSDDGILEHKCAITAIKKIRQKPTWHAEDEKNLNAVLSFIGDEYLRRWLKDIIHKEYDEPTAWSEEDKNFMYDTLSNLTELKDRFGEEYGRVGGCISWLKSLKDRVGCEVNCTTTKEWSEEDEKHIHSIISTIECCKAQFKEAIAVIEQYDSDLDWFKSLRPQSQRRPSDEQIKVCKEVYADILSAKGFDLGTVNSELNRLGEELKKGS